MKFGCIGFSFTIKCLGQCGIHYHVHFRGSSACSSGEISYCLVFDAKTIQLMVSFSQMILTLTLLCKLETTKEPLRNSFSKSESNGVW